MVKTVYDGGDVDVQLIGTTGNPEYKEGMRFTIPPEWFMAELTEEEKQEMIKEGKFPQNFFEVMAEKGSRIVVSFKNVETQHPERYVTFVELSSLANKGGYSPRDPTLNGERLQVYVTSPQSHNGKRGEANTFDLSEHIRSGPNTLEYGLELGSSTHLWLKRIVVSDGRFWMPHEIVSAYERGSKKPM